MYTVQNIYQSLVHSARKSEKTKRGERGEKKKRATIVYEMAISDSNSNHLNKKNSL
jgi:hypothetical protein